jgi:predicted metal-binding membrane protein
MNLLWVALIAALVLIEKILPAGEGWARLSGATLGLVGLALLVF